MLVMNINSDLGSSNFAKVLRISSTNEASQGALKILITRNRNLFQDFARASKASL